jgi:dinuclear metal center YbgI/SA1388 family protein
MRQSEISDFLESIAPLNLAESWDPVGWLVGDPSARVERVMTCLTVSPVTVEEAVTRKVDLIVSHHPIPFRPVARLTTGDYTGNLLWRLAGAGIGVFSLHTAWDSAPQGINQQLAEAAGCRDIRPLIPRADLLDGAGSGRAGSLAEPVPVAELLWRLRQVTGTHFAWQHVGTLERTVSRVAFGCGAGGSFLDAARRSDCELLVTGEASFHTCLEADSTGLSMLLLGHYASERFAVESLAAHVQKAFPALRVWASELETDPVVGPE